MSDVIYVLLTLVVFILLALLVGLLDRRSGGTTDGSGASPDAADLAVAQATTGRGSK